MEDIRKRKQRQTERARQIAVIDIWERRTFEYLFHRHRQTLKYFQSAWKSWWNCSLMFFRVWWLSPKIAFRKGRTILCLGVGEEDLLHSDVVWFHCVSEVSLPRVSWGTKYERMECFSNTWNRCFLHSGAIIIMPNYMWNICIFICIGYRRILLYRLSCNFNKLCTMATMTYLSLWLRPMNRQHQQTSPVHSLVINNTTVEQLHTMDKLHKRKGSRFINMYCYLGLWTYLSMVYHILS